MFRIILVFVLLAFAMPAMPAMAGQPFVKVFDSAVKKHCGACHMVFNPEMLPAKSWQNIMKGLGDHFGQKVSLDAGLAGKIEAFLVNRASDMSGSQNGRDFMEGVNREEPPLRIIDTPRFKEKHKAINDQTFAIPAVKTKSNCIACHAGAPSGDYEAKTAKIPGG